MKNNTSKLTTMAMLCAIAYIIIVVIRIPIIPPPYDFLKYDPKDIVLTIGAFIYGPGAGAVMCAVVALLEMVTISTTGIIGCIMNFIQSAGFVCVASLIYKRNHTLRGAVTGLVAGTLSATCLMLLWNYFLTPIYTGMPREIIAPALLTVFLPFNLIKGSINAALTQILYKRVVTALRSIGIVPASKSDGRSNGKVHIIVALIIFIASVGCAFLAYKGIL